MRQSIRTFGQTLGSAGRKVWVATALVLFTLALSGVVAAQAAIQVSNLGQGTSTTLLESSWDPEGQGFQTGTHPAGYSLTSVQLHIESFVTPATIADMNITLRTRATGSVARPVFTDTVTFSNPTFTSAGTYTFTVPTGTTINLTADTAYFVVVDINSTVNNSGVNLGRTSATDEDSGAAAGWEIHDDSYWPSGFAWMSNGYAYRIAVDATLNNTPATGLPTITGTATAVGDTLTASTTGIADADGLTGVSYSYQWIRVDDMAVETAISGATSSTYTLVAADVGKHFKVRVTFQDDGGFAESLTSKLHPARTGGICARTEQVRDAIVAATTATTCANVTATHLSGLRMLDLRNQSISSLQAGDFAGLTAMGILRLDNNALTTLPSGLFTGLTALRQLYLLDNVLSSLPANIFTGLTALERLHLERNALSSLPADLFDGLTALTDLSLSGNVLTLSGLPADLFDGLTALDDLILANNDTLTTLPAGLFTGLIKLDDLNLSRNALSSLPAGIFDGLTELDTLRLNNNALTSLPANVFQDLTTLTTLRLQSNSNTDPFAPTAEAGEAQMVSTGATVALAGSSSGPWGTNVTYEWTQTSGTTVTLTGADTVSPSFTAPSTAGDLVFTLTVTGMPAGAGGTATGTDTVTVTKEASDIICARTEAVRDAILAKITGVTDCALVTDTHLAAITGSLLVRSKGITALAEGDFDGLTALTTLSLENNSLTALPDGVFDELTALQALNLASNNLAALPDGVFDSLTALQILGLKRNELTALPAGVFDSLTALIGLGLNENNLAALPDGVFDGLTKLPTLDLSQNKLTTLPAGVFDELTALTTLELQDNELAALPAGVFDGLISLGTLWLYENELAALPAGVFGGLTALTTLQLQENELAALPAEVFDGLTALTQLRLSFNHLTALPAEVFDGLTALTALHLNNNRSLTGLPAGVFDGLTALTSLDLRSNQLAALPAGVFEGLTALRSLDLRFNSLAALTDDVFQPLTSLTSLDLSWNPGTPFSPTAVALPDDGTVPAAGGTVMLDGSGSGGAWGTNVTYSWALTTPTSGVTVTFDDNSIAEPTVTIAQVTASTDFVFTLTVTGRASGNGSTADTDTAAVTTTTPNSTPTVENVIPDQTATAGAGFTYQFPANTFDDTDTSDTLSYMATKADDTDLPTWLSFDAATRTFTGTPAAADLGILSVKVTADDSHGGLVSDDFNITVAATVPGAPTGLTATANGSTRIKLSWTAPADNGGSFITGYKIEVSIDSGSNWTELVADTDSTTPTTYEHSGLAAGTTRHYRVYAINSVGTGPTASSVANATTSTTPDAPTLISNVGQGSTFNSAGTNFTAQRFTTGSNAAGYSLDSIEMVSTDAEGDDVALSVRTVDASGFPDSLHATLSAPSNFTAGTLIFTAPPNTVLGASTTYSVVIEKPSGEPVKLTITTSDAEDAGGAAGWSIEDSFDQGDGTGSTWTSHGTNAYRIAVKGTPRAATAPGAPTGLTATASGTDTITLSWTAPVDNGGRAITGYKIEVSTDSETTWSDQVANTASTTTTYEHTGLTASTTRHYRVSAINSSGTSTPSDVVNTTSTPSDVVNTTTTPSDVVNTTTVAAGGGGRRSAPSFEPEGYLGNPGAASFQSGIGLISGWVCEAEVVEIEIATARGTTVRQEAAYGTERLDTADTCGDTDNGFGLLFNWNLLGDGEHTVIIRVNDVELSRATVTVTTLGSEFLRDVAGTCPVPDFPSPGETVTLVWQETQQNFVIRAGPAPTGRNRAGSAGMGYLENPGPNSFQSGIGVISGWVCEGDEVEITTEAGAVARHVAAYGTERRDTAEACGDTDNGFGLLFNWNLLGEGEHAVVAYVDGEELGHATVRVTTLGEEFLRGAEGECVVDDFPAMGQTVTLEWQQTSQNFVMTAVE